jgi:hypothetical protein
MQQQAILNIFTDAYDNLVADVTAAVIRTLKADGAAQVALDKEALAEMVLGLITAEGDIRLELATIAVEATEDYDNRVTTLENDRGDFDSLERRVDGLETRIDDFEENDGSDKIDADNDDFQQAVCGVIRNLL